MDIQRRTRTIVVIDPREERVKEFHRAYDLIRNIIQGPRLSLQRTLKTLIEGLERAEKRYIIYANECEEDRIASYSRITEVKTEDPHTYLSISNVLYEGKQEKIIAIYVRKIPEKPSQCLIA